ncbi:putative inner membrane protein [Shimia thalassica]|uniref:Putative inner membrane protein n=1 Tax=Shimia thalassica TaxID=1715693 RepID=A0A0P1ICW7_9RHOB|nr:YeeE/YedE family protein [Shimia thalassica]CUJ89990.1 putative inner membrane protein [Shimia thalassica]
MFETFGFENLTAPQVTVFFALAVGVLFGFFAERTQFCFRRALVGHDRRAAAGVWLLALAVAMIGTQVAVFAELISFGDHRFMTSDLPVVAILLGGALFGAGMVLTRGCASRLTVLSGTGNLRALMVLFIFAFVAHATLKGLLSPLRVGLGGITVSLENAALPGPAGLWVAVVVLVALLVAVRSGNTLLRLLGAVAIGALVPLAWVGTGFVLYDDFDPVAFESLSFTAPAADSLFFTVASTAVSANFGVGLIGGVIAGSLLASLLFKSFQWRSFETPRQTGRYMFGAVLMGFGGVLAGGCTVGAGLSGLPTLSISAVLAVAAIAAGALATNSVLSASLRGSGAPSTTPPLQPAE